MVPDLKNYMDLTITTERQEYQILAEQWEKSQPYKRNIFRHVSGYKQGYQNRDSARGEQSQNSQFPTGKKSLSCFSCGKIGHLSWECRSRPLETHKQESTSVGPRDVKPIVCFTCQGVGHKSPQCPKHPKDKVKRIAIPVDKITPLNQNDVMSEIEGVRIPLTFDSGAMICSTIRASE